jgi:hypothetical protein
MSATGAHRARPHRVHLLIDRVRRPHSRSGAAWHHVPRHRGGLLPAPGVPQEHDAPSPGVDPAGLVGRARPAPHLRRIRHVDRARHAARGKRDRQPVRTARRRAGADQCRALLPRRSPQGIRQPGQEDRTSHRQVGHDQPHPVGTLRHASRPGATRAGSGEPRPADAERRKEGRRPAAEADRSDGAVLPAGHLHRHSRAGHPQVLAL